MKIIEPKGGLEKFIWESARPLTIAGLILFFCCISPTAFADDSAGSVWEVPSNVKPTPDTFDLEIAGVTKVIFYTAPLCNPCSDVLTFLRDHGVDFEERSLLSVPGAVNVVVKGIRAPTVEIWYSDGKKQRVTGYDEKLLRQFLTGVETGGAQDSFGISDFDFRGTGSQ